MTHFPPPVPRPAPVDVVLPCLDEAAALPWVLARIPAGWRAIVVDNGSTDGSAETARGLGATVVHEPRRGFGAACHAGLLAADADIVCFCDCDALSTGRPRSARRGPRCLAAARAGRQRRTGPDAAPPHRTPPARPRPAARRPAHRAARTRPHRPPQRLPLQMVVRAADAGWRVEERAVPYRPRTGRSKVTGTWRGTWHAVRDMRAVLQQPPFAPRTEETAR
ncbi:glycosyltransferase [Streptomyces sp. RPA4-5]|uniref:glycosyltransferase n=1 Tax=Streptomyces sp. RPA4-5 TaxID=2721245 RepID=UPI0032B495D9